MEQKPTIIVTGSSGLIGSAVCRRLAGAFRVFGFDRPGAPHPPEEATNVPVDLTDDQAVLDGYALVARQAGPDVASVVHLAAYYDFGGDDSPMYEKLTVDGTRRMLRGLPGLNLRQFVFSSTMLVHAPVEPGQTINEESLIEPTWAYPASKVRTEQLISELRGDVPAVMLRIAGVYDDLCHSIPIAHQIARIDRRELTARVYAGTTSHGQAFVHLVDVVEAIRLAVERRASLPPEVAILIGEPRTLSYDELQHTIARLLHGESFETLRVPKPLAKAGAWAQDLLPGQDPFIKPWMIDRASDHYELEITRAADLLGWSPRRSLRETLPKMIDALKADRAAWYRENKLDAPEEEARRSEHSAGGETR